MAIRDTPYAFLAPYVDPVMVIAVVLVTIWIPTRFAWRAVPGVAVYKVEIFSAEPGPAGIASDREVTTPVPLDPTPDTAAVAGRQPLTGTVVPGTQTEIRLQDYSLAHLPADRRYLWTVKAMDAEGALLGVSPPREIFKP